ncbi:MAG: DinB family protein [Vicinamibacterales bacterium]
MQDMLRDLIAHKGYANAALLAAVREAPPAASDAELLALLHHILLANRFWLLAVLGHPFIQDEEAAPAPSFEALVQRYRQTQIQEASWLATATDRDLARMLEDTRIPGGQCTVAQALTQVCLHSHGHRAQCARLLRHHGGSPPATDFIRWVASRPDAAWPAALADEPGS